MDKETGRNLQANLIALKAVSFNNSIKKSLIIDLKRKTKTLLLKKHYCDTAVGKWSAEIL